MIPKKVVTSDGKGGGWLKGKRHSEGGIKAIVTDSGTPVELEGGEIIITRKASKEHCEELSKINQSGGGVAIPCDVSDSAKSTFGDGGPISELQIGKYYNHPIFGKGELMKIDENGTVLELSFDVGHKRLLRKFTRLTELSTGNDISQNIEIKQPEVPILSKPSVTTTKKEPKVASAKKASAKKTIKDIVVDNSELLKGMKTHTDLRNWAIKQGFDNRSAFPKFKTALNEIGLDYDGIKTGINKSSTEKLENEITHSVTMYCDAKASAGRFGITDEDGNVLWHGRFFEDDDAEEQSRAELSAAKKAVWLASKVKESIGAKAIEFNLIIDAQWLTYQTHGGQKGYALTVLARKYNIKLNVQWIPGKDNPADEWTIANGYKKWQDNDLKALAIPIEKTTEIISEPEIENKTSKEILTTRLKIVKKMLTKNPTIVLKTRAKIIEKMLTTPEQFRDGGLIHSLNQSMDNLVKNGIVVTDEISGIKAIIYNTGNQSRKIGLYNFTNVYKVISKINKDAASRIIVNMNHGVFDQFEQSKIKDYENSKVLFVFNQNEVVYSSENMFDFGGRTVERGQYIYKDIQQMEKGGLIGDIYTQKVYWINLGGGDWSDHYRGRFYDDYSDALSDYNSINAGDFDRYRDSNGLYKELVGQTKKYRFIGEIDMEDINEYYDGDINKYILDYTDDKSLDNEIYWELNSEYEAETLETESVDRINKKADEVLRQVETYFGGKYSTIYLDEEGEIDLKLRIANHSGKHRNKGYEKYFLSIVIADENPTENFYTSGPEGLSRSEEYVFGSDTSAAEIIEFVKDRIRELQEKEDIENYEIEFNKNTFSLGTKLTTNKIMEKGVKLEVFRQVKLVDDNTEEPAIYYVVGKQGKNFKIVISYNFDLWRNASEIEKHEYYEDIAHPSEIEPMLHKIKQNEFGLGGPVGTNAEYDKAVSDLNKAEKLQEIMKKANAIIRSKKNVSARLVSEAGLTESNAYQIQQPDYAGRVGFATYQLTNNNASIKRLQERVKMLEGKLAGAEKGNETFEFESEGGGTIEVNYDIDRVQIMFNTGRVPNELYKKLRSNGYVYSPSNKAFQRKITPQAISNAKYLFKPTENKIIEQEQEQSPEIGIASEEVIYPNSQNEADLDIDESYDVEKGRKLKAINEVNSGKINADDAAIKLDESGVEVSNEVYDQFREAEANFKKGKNGLQVGDTVTVKGKNGNPNFKGNFRGITNEGKYVVVGENGYQNVYEKSDIVEQSLKETPKEESRTEWLKKQIANGEKLMAKISFTGDITPDINRWKAELAELESAPLKEHLQSLNYDENGNPVGIEPKEYVEITSRLEKIESGQSETIFKGVNHEYKNQYELNKAIEELLDSKADNYSTDEKNFIRKYSGYGGLDKYGKTGKGGLFEYYTPKEVIEKMWALAYKFGYDNGAMLEPSIATGEFLRYAPANIKMVGYEINPYSAKICKILYPTAEIHLQPFEQTFIKNNYTVKDKTDHLEKFKLVIGNPPYGDFSIVESRYMSGMGEKDFTKARNYVEYFIRRGMDLLESGGLLIYIVGSQLKAGGKMFLDGDLTPVKEWLSDNATFETAYRLPDTIFERTGVTADIIVLRKK